MTETNKKMVDDLDFSSLEENIEEEKINTEANKNQINQTKDEKEITLNRSQILLMKKLLQNIKENNERLIQLLAGFFNEEEEKISIGQITEKSSASILTTSGVGLEGKIIEGVFDGENMIGPDGKQYSVPANYASKSKLVEGDILKLTITANGTFIYKQIGPIERKRLVAKLEKDSGGIYWAVTNGRKWRLLTASVTYFKGQDGDEVIILVPKNGESKWAAVENIVKPGAE
jgi:hypothetical protein